MVSENTWNWSKRLWCMKAGDWGLIQCRVQKGHLIPGFQDSLTGLLIRHIPLSVGCRRSKRVWSAQKWKLRWIWNVLSWRFRATIMEMDISRGQKKKMEATPRLMRSNFPIWWQKNWDGAVTGTSSMCHMYCAIIHLDGFRLEREVRQSCRWHCPKKEMAERRIGAGMDLTAV